jgi:Protein of unknown function (DUF1572)
MQIDLASAYLANIVATFRTYKALGEKAIAQTPDEALVIELDANSNSIAVVVKHVGGNLRSRFRDFLTSDGEKPDRHRDSEFELSGPASRAQVMQWWDDGWTILLHELEALTPADLTRTVTIRGEALLVAEALNRSVTHTAYHVGQIVYLARHFAGPGWQSLSIPKAPAASAAGS